MGPEIHPCVTQVARGSSCGRRRGASSFAYVIYSQHDGPASPHTLKTYTNAHHGGAQMEYDAGLGSVHCPDTQICIHSLSTRSGDGDSKWCVMVVCVHSRFVYILCLREKD